MFTLNRTEEGNGLVEEEEEEEELEEDKVSLKSSYSAKHRSTRRGLFHRVAALSIDSMFVMVTVVARWNINYYLLTYYYYLINFTV